MSRPAHPPTLDPNSPQPFGTLPRRGNGPLFILGTLYAAWLAVLIWMATASLR